MALIGRTETQYQAFKFERSEWMNQPIAQSWDIIANNITVGATSGTIIEIVAQYNASNQDHDIEILSANCTDPLAITRRVAFQSKLQMMILSVVNTLRTVTPFPLTLAYLTLLSISHRCPAEQMEAYLTSVLDPRSPWSMAVNLR